MKEQQSSFQKERQAESLLAALALLIRYPKANRGQEFDRFAAPFGLDPKHTDILRALSRDRNVAKYGRNMQMARKGAAFRFFNISRFYLTDGVLDRIWDEAFDPQAASIRGVDLTDAFVRHLLTDAHAQKLVAKHAPDFIFDLLRYEHAELIFRQSRLLRVPLPEGSTLVHGNLMVETFEYDIPSFMRHREDIEKSPAALLPKKRQVVFLFLGGLDTFTFRTFEIDPPTADYLRAQLKGKPESASKPPSHASLVELKIVRPGI